LEGVVQQLLKTLPPGKMLSVALPSRELEKLMDGTLSIAVINTQDQIVVSGPAQSIDDLEKLLGEREIEYTTTSEETIF
jgi:phthiocerol/phenolphthiocerol synthesis type-I polyketide synthase E